MTTNFWLDPDGTLHNAGSSHNEWAKKYLIDRFGKTWWDNLIMSDDYRTPYQMLHESGWIRIAINNDLEQEVRIVGNAISLIRPMRNTMEPAMNYKQLAVAKGVCEVENFDFHKAINDKRFW